MLSKNLEQLLNEQINHEFFSEYQYLAATSYFESIELDGFANFFYVQSQEEHLLQKNILTLVLSGVLKLLFRLYHERN